MCVLSVKTKTTSPLLKEKMLASAALQILFKNSDTVLLESLSYLQ